MEKLAQHARELFDLQLAPAQLEALRIYERELLEWNKSVNLTAIRTPEQVRTKHFLDSLSCISVMRGTKMERVIDVGTGAGFPGLPIKLVSPEIKLTMVESVGKKVQFCEHMVAKLKIEDVRVIQKRAETIGRLSAHRQQYDWAVARAVANLPVLVEYLLPLVRIGGTILAMKGESAPAEAHSAEYAIQVLGGHLRKLVPVILPGVVEERYLVVVDKVAATPPKYPRRIGIPAKRPLQRAR
jgi:16S rRNA (guanine527-N7)-methyltransferase